MKIQTCKQALATVLLSLAVVACGNDDPVESKRQVDTSGTEEPAVLSKAEDVARVAGAMALLLQQTDFNGTLYQSDNRAGSAKAQSSNCPDGGSVRYEDPAGDPAVGPLSFSAEFFDCRHGNWLSDGQVAWRCDNPQQECSNGAASFGNESEALLFEESLSGTAGLLFGHTEFEGQRENSSFVREQHALQGQARSQLADARINFVLGIPGQAFIVTRTRSDQSYSATLSGPFALAASAANHGCQSGRAVVATVQPLSVSHSKPVPVVGGELRFTNTSGEVGTVLWESDGSILATGDDGSQLRYEPDQFIELCRAG